MSTTRGVTPALLGGGEQRVDERRRRPVRRGREQRRLRQPATASSHFCPRGEALLGIGARQMRKRRGERLAGLAVGHRRREPEVRMHGEQPQQLAGHVAAAAEHDCRNRRAQSAGIAPLLTARAPRSPRSPSAAPSLSALKAGTPICVLMISTPTWLSVAGSGHHARLDAEALAQQLHAAPGRDRVVGRKHHAGERARGCPAHSRIASTP